MAWGEEFVQEVGLCIRESALPRYPIFLITDSTTTVDLPGVQVVRTDFELGGKSRKAEMLNFLPRQHDSFLFLDSDTRVLDDISLGFIKAETHGVAVSPAPHFSLNNFFGFGKLMDGENVPPLGQMQYNTGVIFFVRSPSVDRLLLRWRELTQEHQDSVYSDQPFFSLAMEQLAFSPYALPPTYNCRGFGEHMSGRVRIWHSRHDVPSNLNENENSWPPRSVVDGRVVRNARPVSFFQRIRRKLRRGFG